MTHLIPLFTAIIAGLRVAIANHAQRNPPQAPLLNRACCYLSGSIRRLQRLFTLWQAGTLPAPGPARSGRAGTPPATPRLPNAKTWLVARVGYTAAGYGSQLGHLIATPEFTTFIREAPQAGRILRPLCNMLGLATPPALLLPPRCGPPRPRPPCPRPSGASRPPRAKPAAPAPWLTPLRASQLAGPVRMHLPGHPPKFQPG